MADMITEAINTLTGFFNQYYAVILVIMAAAFIMFWWLSKNQKKEEHYKPVVLEQEINKYIKSEFDLTAESIGYGKTLYIGSRDAGFVLKSIFMNQYPTWEETKNVNALKRKYPSTTEKLDKENKIINILHGFEVCGKGRLNRIMANLFGYGITIYLIDKPLVEINESSVNINPYSKPIKMFGTWIFSDWGLQELEEIAFKIKHEQHLDAMVNIIPKSIFLGDINAGKEKASYDMLEEVNKERRKEQLEQIKKA